MQGRIFRLRKSRNPQHICENDDDDDEGAAAAEAAAAASSTAPESERPGGVLR
jgi:hypothetical protein